ncbi:hypothetical protein EQ805_14340, partial [Staphylococcus epidermidis]
MKSQYLPSRFSLIKFNIFSSIKIFSPFKLLNITLHFLHILNDLLYPLAQEYTSHYEVKKDIGFKRNLVEILIASNNDTHRQIGTI